MINYLTEMYREAGCKQEDIEQGAWDLCRTCQIFGMGYGLVRICASVGRGCQYDIKRKPQDGHPQLLFGVVF